MLQLKVHHIGYLVKKIEAAVTQFQRLGYSITRESVYDEYRKVYICFMDKDGYNVELISPASPDSVVTGLMKKYKNCPYHICYESEAFESDLNDLCSNGYTAIDEPCPAPALSGRRVVFLINPQLGMIELLETDPQEK